MATLRRRRPTSRIRRCSRRTRRLTHRYGTGVSPRLITLVVRGPGLGRRNPSYPSDELVFTNTEGRPVLKNRLAVTFRQAAKKMGLEGLSFRFLRHHYASLLIHGGESVKVVQARLGHSSASITLDVYSHLWPDSEDRTRNAVDAAWRADFSRTATAKRE